MPSLSSAQLLLKLVIEYQGPPRPKASLKAVEYNADGTPIEPTESEPQREFPLWALQSWRERTKTNYAPWDKFADASSKIGLSKHAEEAIRGTIAHVSPRNPALRH